MHKKCYTHCHVYAACVVGIGWLSGSTSGGGIEEWGEATSVYICTPMQCCLQCSHLL
jgi:hypothetical protein